MDTLLIVTGFAFSIFIWNIHIILPLISMARGVNGHMSHRSRSFVEQQNVQNVFQDLRQFHKEMLESPTAY